MIPEAWQTVSNEVWLEVFGRSHPMVLHLPFGVLAALFLLELWCVMRRRPLEFQMRAVLVGLALVSSAVAAGSGWFLGQESDYGGETLVTHRNLGIGVAGVSLVMAAAAWRDMRQLYGVALGVAMILLLAAGHHGGAMTHGDGFLFEPVLDALEEEARDDVPAGRLPVSVAEDGSGEVLDPVAGGEADGSPVATSTNVGSSVPAAQSILTRRCSKCHGANKQKGGLAMHDLTALLAGGDSGPAVVPGDPAASLMVQRMRLPLDDDDRMPPSNKPQPTPEEVEAIGAWITAGLPGDGQSVGAAVPAIAPVVAPVVAPAAEQDSEPDTAAAAEVSNASSGDAEPPVVAAVASLRSEQVHVESADPATGLLWVDFGARPDTTDGDVAELVDELRLSIGELSLAGTSVGDSSTVMVSCLPFLGRLDLSNTAVTSQGLRDLRACARLAVLDLTGTAVDDTGVESLVEMPSLERVYVWDTAVTESGVARLRTERPELEVIDGRNLLSEALETEPEPVMTELKVDAPGLGSGSHTYEWVSDWLQLPEGQAELGNTHGEIVVDRAGNLYLNTDTEQAVMVFAPDGSHLRSWGAEFASGLHGMQLVEEDGEEYLYFVHFGRHEAIKATLAGEIVWRMSYPEASGKYDSVKQFRPTSIAVAPDGSFFVADGYGEHWVHQYDADRRWVRSLGGPGTEPGQFNTPHGVWVDTRGDEPVLIVADRENHRLQRFDMNGELLGIVEGMLRRPCKVQQQGEYLVIPDLAGRVTILDGDDALVTHLGDNPDVGKRANNGVARDAWVDGEFLAPHSAAWDAGGNLYVMDWNRHGRITKLRRVE